MDVIKNIFANHKSKILIFLLMIPAFAIAFFPYDDFSDIITSQVAENTPLYLQFEDLSLGFLPQPGAKMSKVLIEAPGVQSEIHADTLRLAPSLLAFIKLQPLFRAKAENLFKGNLDFSTSPASKIKGPQAFEADIEFTNFDLATLVKTVSPVPIKANGTMSLDALVEIDLEGKSQPDGDVLLTSPKVDVPAFTMDFNTPGMNGVMIKQSISLPKLDIGRVQLKGKLKDGKIKFSDSVIGSDKNDIFAKIGGDIDVQVRPGSVAATYYNLQLDLTLKNSFLASLGSYGAMVDLMIGKYGQKTADGKRFLFRLQMNPTVDAAPIFAPY